MDKTIKVSGENYKLIDKLAKQQRRSRKTILSMAIEYFFKAKKNYLKE